MQYCKNHIDQQIFFYVVVKAGYPIHVHYSYLLLEHIRLCATQKNYGKGNRCGGVEGWRRFLEIPTLHFRGEGGRA